VVLSSVKRTLELVAGRSADEVLISYPVNFTLSQYLELRKAYSHAGFKIVRAVSEAAAATIALEEATNHKGGIVFILDIGGGTLDAALVEMGDGVIEIIDVHGDRELGGRDFDEVLRNVINLKIEEINSNARGQYWIPECSPYDEQIEKLTSY